MVEKHELSRRWKGCHSKTRHPSSRISVFADGVDAAPVSPVLEDNLLAPRLDPPVLSIYVDNFATIGTNAAHVREVEHAVWNGAYALGLKTHEFSTDSGNFELLGLSCSEDGQSGSGSSGRHSTNFSGSVTPPVVISASLFVFAGREFTRRRRLWPAARRELVRSCLPLKISDLSLCSGATNCMHWTSLSGVEERATPLWRELVSASGRFSERWRFTAPLSFGVRTLARREIVDTVCQEEGEDAARSVCERIMDGHIATILNPASVIL